MKAILQSLKTGVVELVDLPAPRLGSGQVLISTTHSLISAGTERMLVDFGKANMLDKARQQPDKVRAVLNKIGTDGLLPTLKAVENKLDQPIPLGYCNVGTVIDVGADIRGLKIGDRVASNGKHAEIVSVGSNLCARVPDNVSDEAAAFTVIGAIALQGLRLANPTIGECFVVIGLGLIGLMTVQLLKASGCRVLGVDFDDGKLQLARSFGAETVTASSERDVFSIAHSFSGGHGVDGVIITAATKSDAPVRQAAQMCRKRGRIILVGVAGLNLSRADFYEKELTFQVSCSYGPGRYDPAYEERGQDYPIGFVRWTEQRNFSAVLGLMSGGQLDVTPLISHRFGLEDFQKAYALVGGEAPSLGIVLSYPRGQGLQSPAHLARNVELNRIAPRSGEPVVGVIGAGNYAGQVLVPALKKTGATLHTIISAGGITGEHVGRRNGFANVSSEADTVLFGKEINSVVIATRHDQHARQVISALDAGKNVFVEKPLALDLAELESITEAYFRSRAERGTILAVGFNRRFAPHITRMKALLGATSEPKSFIMTVNAGFIPPTHWTRDQAIGGGRVVGEACHFVDLLRHLAGYRITDVVATPMRGKPGDPDVDTLSFTLKFEDGSCGTVHYLANGSKAFPKERLEVFCGGGVLQLDNFRRLTAWGWPGFRKMNLWSQDKGNEACIAAFIEAVRTGSGEIMPFEELHEVTRVSVEISQDLNV